MESLLSDQDASSEYFSKAFMSPQGLLCVCLNRPMAFSETLARVAEEGERYGHTHSDHAPSSPGEGRHVLLLNDVCVLKHALSSGEGCGLAGKGRGLSQRGADTGGISLSEARGLLLVGVASNLLRASGHEVHQHSHNIPASCVSYVTQYTLGKLIIHCQCN